MTGARVRRCIGSRRSAGYWAEDYDWRRREERLNWFAQFTTEIDGLDIHYVHARSPHADAMPLIIEVDPIGWTGIGVT